MPPTLSVVLPTYNEQEGIATAIDKIRAYFKSRNLTGEILVVDDGSTDETVASAAACAPGTPAVRLLPGNRNRGKGEAVRRGMLAARGDFILFTDADLSTPMTEFDRFSDLLKKGNPVVIGSRKLDPGRVIIKQPFYRQFMGRIFSWMARCLLNPEVTDFTCGFKAFRREVATTLFSPLTLDGWAFDAELLQLAQIRRIPVMEVPVQWSNRAGSRVRLWRDIPQAAADLVRLLWRRWRGHYRREGPVR
ncbi:MAG: dolichyl-phosphate beta-glucosyltransferase [Acidobacteriota bacterium]